MNYIPNFIVHCENKQILKLRIKLVINKMAKFVFITSNNFRFMHILWCINFPHIKPLKSPEVIEFCGGI